MTHKDLDLLGVKPIARAIEHASTTTIDGISAFFGAICMPAAEEFGLVLRDKVAKFRQENLHKIADKTKEKIAATKIEPTGECNPRLIHEVIEHGSWESDACVQSMWAGLLACATETSAASDDSLIYLDTLKRLTPFQARLLNAVYSDPRSCSVRHSKFLLDDSLYTPDNTLHFSTRDLLELYPDDLSKFVNIYNVTHEEILENSDNYPLALGRFRPQIDGLVALNLFRDARPVNGGKGGYQFLPTLKGLDLYMRGSGYKMYPLEAFIVTQQHWASLKSIDPFTYRKT